MLQSEIPRANVLGVGISAINMGQALLLFEDWLSRGEKGYVCVTGVHGVMEAQKDASFRKILNESLITTPDGMPTVWVGRLEGFKNMGRVFGPDLMDEICRLSVGRGYTHFFYGGRPGVAEALRRVMTARHRGLRVVGTYTPPFGSLSQEEEKSVLSLISEKKPDIIWVGISTPKQEKFMAEYSGKLDAKIMVGVGAAFDLHTGLIVDAPAWVKTIGLQWFHRFLQDPKRLWKRYFQNNPRFLLKISLQLTRLVNYSLD